ncbi:MAG: hypothetical protein KDD37_03215 [Bdellovibrionales bacterium]|nr:hypothetical protein [Bdellovibrionales bacterium]
MRFEELKEQTIESAKFYIEKIKENPAFIQAQEKYEELSPNVQKVIKYGAAFFFIYFVFSFPISWNNQANENLAKYQKNRGLIEDLLNIQSEIKNAPNVRTQVDGSQLQVQANDLIEKSGLAKEQVTSTSVVTSAQRKFTFIPEEINYVGVQVVLSKLNLTQVLDIGTKLQNVNDAKLIELSMAANKDDNHYYDVTYLVASFTGSSNNE